MRVSVNIFKPGLIPIVAVILLLGPWSSEVAMATVPGTNDLEPISNLHPPQTDKQAGQVNNSLKHALLSFPAVT